MFLLHHADLIDFDHILKNRPEDHSVRAIIVYPMNALINSQLAALQAFAKNWPTIASSGRVSCGKSLPYGR